MGYFVSGIASAVMLISIIQFFRTGDNDERIFRRLEEKDKVAIYGSTVLQYKRIGALAISIAGVVINVCIILMHLDTFFFPSVWRKVFCDGSLLERNLIFFLIVFWASGLYFCTSSFSVGEVQANVYFTAWIAFTVTVVNYGVWRSSAGLPAIEDVMGSQRETTYNWLGTLFFNFITAFAICDFYGNRDHITFVIDGKVYKPARMQWVQAFSIVWGSVGICLFELMFNNYWKGITRGSRVVLDGRYLEGVLLLCMISLWFWILVEFTGVGRLASGPSNAYFGTWGTFFGSIITFGTWLKENKNRIKEGRDTVRRHIIAPEGEGGSEG